MDAALLRSYADQGMTRQQISEATGLSYSRTTTLLRENGINVKRKPYVNTKPIKQNVQQALDLRKEGLSYKKIATILDAPWERVAAACRDHGMGGSAIEQRLTEGQVADYVSRSGFDYVGGYISQRKPIVVRCRDCGRTFERVFHIFRDVATGTWPYGNVCPLCKLDKQTAERERRESIRKAEKERDAQEKAQRKAEQLSRKISDQLIKRLATRVCKNCGKEFCIELSDYHSEIYCSEACQKRCHDRIKRDKRIRRMKARGMDQDITLEKLYRRDGGACYLCGRMCDWADGKVIDGQFVAGESYPSIDHVKPISKGGAHTWENVKLACRHCNTVKGWR